MEENPRLPPTTASKCDLPPKADVWVQVPGPAGHHPPATVSPPPNRSFRRDCCVTLGPDKIPGAFLPVNTCAGSGAGTGREPDGG